jgi:diguanylate cyclase (GGDEF)-like protein
MTHSPSERYAILAPPSTGDRIGAIATLAVALSGIVVAAPVAHTIAGPNPGFVALIYASLMLAAFFVAGMLAALYRVSALEPLAILALAYGYAAVVIALYVMALPGVMLPGSALGGSAAAEWLWICAHAGFVALSIAYALAEWIAADDLGARSYAVPALRAAVGVTALGLVTGVIAALAAQDRLPHVIVGSAFTPLLRHAIAPGLAVGYGVAIAILGTLTRFRTTTQLWVAVVLGSLACEVLVAGSLANARYSAAWYAGCFEGVVASGAFLNLIARQVNSVLATFAATNRELADRSVRDALTQLLNRRGFDDRMAELAHIQRRRRISSVCLAIVDIDHFKAVNDTFGHVAGDQVLRSVAAAIEASCARSRDACYRLGGEEFAVVLPATDFHGALVVAERIRANVAALAIASGGTPGATLTVSVGLAVVDGARDVDSIELYRRADTALLSAKRAGRDRTVVYEEALKIA